MTAFTTATQNAIAAVHSRSPGHQAFSFGTPRARVEPEDRGDWDRAHRLDRAFLVEARAVVRRQDGDLTPGVLKHVVGKLYAATELPR